MKKTLGSAVIIDTNPPYRRWNGNQATYLFFPVFISFLLTLLGTLSSPLIPGLATAIVHVEGGGRVTLGAWGLCLQSVPGIDAECGTYPVFGNTNSTAAIKDIPAEYYALGINPSPGSDQYKIASAVMHVVATFICWVSVSWTLAASGQWHNRQLNAYDWARWAWWSNTLSLVVGIVPVDIAHGTQFGMDIQTVVQAAGIAKLKDGQPARVTAGETIFMSAAAIFLNLVTLIVRYAWSRRQPRPTWSVKGQETDYHHNPGTDRAVVRAQILSMGGSGPNAVHKDLPPIPEVDEKDANALDLPPTWESLNLDSATRPVEKVWTRADDATATHVV